MEQVISDGQACKFKIIEEIKSAKYTIKVAMAFFTDNEIADALISASKRGVEVKVVLSDEDTNDEIREKLEGKVSLFIFDKKGRGLMNHKFCIIDNSRLLYGSYNYTYNASKNNKESLTITDSYNLITEYSNIFENLIKEISMTDKYYNETTNIPFTQEDNYLEKFIEQLRNLISKIYDDFNYKEIEEEGRKIAEENFGSPDMFLAYLDNSLNTLRTKISKDDYTKNLIKTQMKASLEEALNLNLKRLETEERNLKNNFNLQRSNLKEKIELLKNEINEKQDEYNKTKILISKINGIINELQNEIDELDRQIDVRNFWTTPTTLLLGLTILVVVAVILIFSSAVWKVFYEEGEILKLLTRGITPEKPPLVDANALIKIYSKKGMPSVFLSVIISFIPILLTNSDLLSNLRRWISIFLQIIGFLIFDIVVAYKVSQHNFEIKRLMIGSSEKWEISDVFTSGDFWFIFIFGALSLLVLKFLIKKIMQKYLQSKAEYVNREKNLLRKSKVRELNEKKQEIDELNNSLSKIELNINDLKLKINEFGDEIRKINADENKEIQKLQIIAQNREEKLREVYNSFLSNLEAGNRQFLKEAIRSRINAFKTGFIKWINYYFSAIIASQKCQELEKVLQNWEKENFE